jgi:hypothetical protein
MMAIAHHSWTTSGVTTSHYRTNTIALRARIDGAGAACLCVWCVCLLQAEADAILKDLPLDFFILVLRLGKMQWARLCKRVDGKVRPCVRASV